MFRKLMDGSFQEVQFPYTFRNHFNIRYYINNSGCLIEVSKEIFGNFRNGSFETWQMNDDITYIEIFTSN